MTQHNNWPKGWRTIPNRKGIYFKPPEHARHLWDDKQTFKLGNSEVEAYRTWFDRCGESDDLKKLTVEEMLDTFMAEHVAVYLAPATYDTYKDCIKPLKAVFGKVHPGSIKVSQMYRYMDKRQTPERRTSPYREASVMSSALNFALRKGWIEVNPLKGNIQKQGKFSEAPRERLPTAEDLESFVTSTYLCNYRPDRSGTKGAHELPVCPDWLKKYVALKMITGLRQGQMLAINLTEQWDGERLSPPAIKRGKATVYSGDGLKVAIDAILGDRLPRGHLFIGSNGKPIGKSMFRSAWTRSMKRFEKAGGEKFHEHDIRKYTATEAETLEHARKLLNHTTVKVTGIYRLKEEVEVLGTQDG